MSHPSKAKGYRGEVTVVNLLQGLGFTGAERTGSLAYKDSAPDIVQEGATVKVHLVATQADRRPVLLTMSAADLGVILDASAALDMVDLVVQVKKRKTFAIDTLYRKLVEAVK